MKAWLMVWLILAGSLFHGRAQTDSTDGVPIAESSDLSGTTQPDPDDAGAVAGDNDPGMSTDDSAGGGRTDGTIDAPDMSRMTQQLEGRLETAIRSGQSEQQVQAIATQTIDNWVKQLDGSEANSSALTPRQSVFGAPSLPSGTIVGVGSEAGSVNPFPQPAGDSTAIVHTSPELNNTVNLDAPPVEGAAAIPAGQPEPDAPSRLPAGADPGAWLRDEAERQRQRADQVKEDGQAIVAEGVANATLSQVGAAGEAIMGGTRGGGGVAGGPASQFALGLAQTVVDARKGEAADASLGGADSAVKVGEGVNSAAKPFMSEMSTLGDPSGVSSAGAETKLIPGVGGAARTVGALSAANDFRQAYSDWGKQEYAGTVKNTADGLGAISTAAGNSGLGTGFQVIAGGAQVVQGVNGVIEGQNLKTDVRGLETITDGVANRLNESAARLNALEDLITGNACVSPIP